MFYQGHEETITCTTDGFKNAIQRGYNHEELYNERQLKVTYFLVYLINLKQ